MNGKDRIDGEIVKIRKELEVLILINKKLSVTGTLDDIETRASALSLMSIYSGIEKILQIRLKAIGVEIDSVKWHRDLLNKSLDIKLISEDFYRELKGFLAFRHFVRHAYSFEINQDVIISILKKIPRIIKEFVESQ